MFVVTLKKAGLKKVGVGVICCALVVFSAVLGRYISGRSVMAAAAASASSAPIARNMVPRASASAQVGAATVTDNRRETALHPVRGSIVWAILFPSASR